MVARDSLYRMFLDRVDLIKPVTNVRPSVRTYVRLSVSTQKVSSISLKFGV